MVTQRDVQQSMIRVVAISAMFPNFNSNTGNQRLKVKTMKIKDLDWLIIATGIGYTWATWMAEVPGGMIIRHDSIEGANEKAIDDFLENDEEIPLEAWGRVTSQSMVFVPNLLQIEGV